MTNAQFGVETFGDLAYTEDGHQLTGAETLRALLDEATLADELGIDVIGLGEHHRAEFAVSSPEIVLAAMAMRTKRIHLSTAVTVLSSDDPVRVFERFSTLHALSQGREEVMLGRGSFTESFPLFGYKLENYNELFEEKLAFWQALLKGGAIDWEGKFTQPLHNTTVYPLLPEGDTIKTLIGVGGSPESIVRAAYYDYPVVLAIIGGEPTRFKPFVDLYEKAVAKFDHQKHPLTMHSHGVIAATDEEARAIGWQYLKAEMDKIGQDRGWAPMTKERFEFEIESGSYYIGSPETVAQKIAKNMLALNMNRFDLVYGAGGQKRSQRQETLRLYATEVIPRVRTLLAGEINGD